MDKKLEYRLSGSGGQGLITTGIILGEAAVLDGYNVVQTQSYGPEARGGASKAEVVISFDEIYYPKVKQPDILLVMSEEAARKYGSDVKKDTIVIIDSSTVKNFESEVECIVYNVPVTQAVKKEFGKTLTANIACLGLIAKVNRDISYESIKKAVLNRVPKGTEEMNMKSLEIGYGLI